MVNTVLHPSIFSFLVIAGNQYPFTLSFHTQKCTIVNKWSFRYRQNYFCDRNKLRVKEKWTVDISFCFTAKELRCTKSHISEDRNRLWPWHHWLIDERTINYNTFLNSHNSFRLWYWLLQMSTFFEIAVNVHHLLYVKQNHV